PGLIGRFASDRRPPRSVRAVPRTGRPAPSGGALRLPFSGPARGGDRHHAAARPGDVRTRPPRHRDRPSAARRPGGPGLADPAAAPHLAPGRAPALAAVAGTRAAARGPELLLSAADHGPRAAGRAGVHVQAA